MIKNSSANAGDIGDTSSIPGLGRFPGGGHGSQLHYPCGESHEQRSLVGYSPWGRKESDTTEATEHTQTYTNAELQREEIKGIYTWKVEVKLP